MYLKLVALTAYILCSGYRYDSTVTGWGLRSVIQRQHRLTLSLQLRHGHSLTALRRFCDPPQKLSMRILSLVLLISALWHCWLGDRKGIRPVKSWVLMVTIWLELRTTYSSVVTATSIILSSSKIQNGDVVVPANPEPSGKWPLKWRGRERS